MRRKRLFVILGILLLAIGVVTLVFYFASRAPISNPTDEYIVQSGDTCRKIAFEHGVSTESLIEANELAPDCGDLTVGQRLIIPLPTP
jgi:LysM repeat protein